MSAGLGIFLGAIIVSLTLLYINRRKNVQQTDVSIQKKVKSFKKLFIASSLMIITGVASTLLYIWISNMPTKQDSYEGIKLGMSMNEVQYIKGSPTGLYKWRTPDDHFQFSVSPENLEVNDSIFNYPEWDIGNININFDKPNGNVVAVGCYLQYVPTWAKSSNEHENACESLSGISIGMSEDDLKHKLGTPDSEIINRTKVVFFKNFKARFFLEKQSV